MASSQAPTSSARRRERPLMAIPAWDRKAFNPTQSGHWTGPLVLQRDVLQPGTLSGESRRLVARLLSLAPVRSWSFQHGSAM